jgi:hypothetical protein
VTLGGVETAIAFAAWDSPEGSGRPGERGAFALAYEYAGEDFRVVEVTPQFSDSIEWTNTSFATEPFNGSDGDGMLQIPFFVRQNALGGDQTANFRVSVFNATRNETTGNFSLTELDSASQSAPFTITGRPTTPTGRDIIGQYGLVAGAAVVLAIGAYVLLHPKKPAYTPRSKALRETAESPKRGRTPPPIGTPPTALEATGGEKARKEILILEAKRDDLVGQIDVARGRLERGEINEFVFNNLKRKKEEALAEVEAAIARLRGNGRGPGG